jgi:carbon storage regulator
MLVLTRKLQQQIKIGEQITVTILRVKGNAVRVGVQAPREVRVVRGELPKLGLSEEAVGGEAVSVEEVVVTIGEAAEDADTSLTTSATIDHAAGETPAPLAASHLPLRRIRNRHGAAPLKQLLASCASLAK